MKNKMLWLILFSLIITACASGSTPTTQPTFPPAVSASPLNTPVAATNTSPPQLTAAETAPSSSAGSIQFETFTSADGTTMEYAVVLPDNFDSQKQYPILLALPPGGQGKDVVQALLDRYWGQEAIRRGWVVLSPAAPGGVLFFSGSERLIPEFLAETAKTYQPEGGKYHLAGISNGGLSAFRIIGNNPELFKSLLVLPGFPQTDADRQKLPSLVNIPVAMFVGGEDTGWLQAMQDTEKELTRLGGKVTLKVIPGEGHILQSLTARELFDLLESSR